MNSLTHSYYSGASDAQIIYETIGSYFDKLTDAHSTNPLLVPRHQGVIWTYGELQTRVDRIATGLNYLGIKPGDGVGLWGPNSIEWVLVQLATAKIGAKMVFINPAYRLDEF